MSAKKEGGSGAAWVWWLAPLGILLLLLLVFVLLADAPSVFPFVYSLF